MSVTAVWSGELIAPAEHCPVSNSLEGAIPIETSIELVDEL